MPVPQLQILTEKRTHNQQHLNLSHCLVPFFPSASQPPLELPSEPFSLL
ncbi:hypothetical protein OIU77_009145 [Salix suchowensis]|uniref:Uncharacterized protein n=1 Tax=Salix suchowensis TaxID=1278906 RepID=A0ABQ9ADD3_9ROSI|nr:hypothetical protein OIU77_009145 [Salix suchowensis]